MTNKVLLSVCPQGHSPTAPHAALPALKAYLAQVQPQTEVVAKDLNAVLYSHLFSPEVLGEYFGPLEAADIREAYLAQRDPSAYQDIPRFLRCHETLERALAGMSERHRSSRNLARESLQLRGNTFTYVSERSSNSRASILESLKPENRADSFFHSFYERIAIPYILKKGFTTLGLSVYLPDQMLPSLLLCAMLKETNPEIRVILGGNYITRFRDVFSKDDALNRKIFDLLDAVVTHEGEIPLKELLERTGDSKALQEVNQTIQKSPDGRIVSVFDSKQLPSMDLNELPRPDFSGIFTDLSDNEPVFWTPTPVISLYTERGCAFAGSCDFCTIMNGNNHPKSSSGRSAEKVAEDLEFYAKTFQTKAFSFCNETLSKEFMVNLSREIKKRGLDLVLDGYTRTDQLLNRSGMDKEMIREISSCFRFLQIGVESLDPGTLMSMRKGRNPSLDSDLFKALFDSGIYPHAFLMTGFPPIKTPQGPEGKDAYINFYLRSSVPSVRWVLDNSASIGTYKPTRFVLPRDDRKILSLDGPTKINSRYSHELRLLESKDLEFNLPFKKINGSIELDKAFNRLIDLLPSAHKKYTRGTIYHQRLFNWREGVAWSRTQSPEEDVRIKKVLRRLWAAAVGSDYIHSQNELSKKGGVSKTKKASLNRLLRETASKNDAARHFPNGIESVAELLLLGQPPDSRASPKPPVT